MSKFFIQMFLSVMVGVSAALGFNSHARSELRETLREANASAHERANAVLELAHDLVEKIDVAVSSKTTAQGSTDNTEKANVKINSTLSVKSNNESSLLNKWMPDLSLDGFFSSKTQTKVETDEANIDVGLKEKVESTLDLGTK